MHRIEIISLQDISASAADFLHAAADRKVIAFSGSMGAGKTTFIKALCALLGVDDIVNSPTFTIINEYATGSGEPLYHFDLYRIEKVEELYDIGFEEYLRSGSYCLIEWPEIAEQLLPEDTLRVSIEEQQNGTRIIIIS